MFIIFISVVKNNKKKKKIIMEFFSDPIGYLFGPPITVESQIKEIHKIMDGSVRDIKKEMMTLRREKNHTEQELRNKAAMGNKTSMKELKQLALRCRRQQNQMAKLSATIDKISDFKSMATQLRSNEAQTRAFIKLTQAMTKMNESSGVFQLCALMNQYERQNMIMQEKQEFMDEKIEEMNEDEEEEEEADNILEAVLDELNIKLTGDMPVVGKQKVQEPVVVVATVDVQESKQPISIGEDDLLASRILNLK